MRADAVEFARGNARAAGVGNLLMFTRQDLTKARPPAGPPGLVVVNPPYGERLGEEDELKPLYRSLGDAVRGHWPGWRLAVFTSNDRLAKRVGLPALTMYALRHTCATLLLLANVNPKVVSERLGHSTIQLTLDTYSHVLPTMQKAAADVLAKLLGPARSVLGNG